MRTNDILLPRERRKKSYIKPSIYYGLEIIGIYLILSIIQVDINPKEWSIIAFILFFIAFFYFSKRFSIVLARQYNL
jgi:uncharacterized membrane protein (GlpM family)